MLQGWLDARGCGVRWLELLPRLPMEAVAKVDGGALDAMTCDTRARARSRAEAPAATKAHCKMLGPN